ncbi:SAF domain-containing protein [Nonomuraea africana]|uniref:Flp pilus assembly protein CpaB n=1 Tax=Nonomuraea africana TaxID=46171 RepID=A0ABR9KNG3_9ACTN|nr:SAF domain-containing protein [Nonomuraea africana]MBE1563567.1 Flp pilus assembly protein CpaB [Nonomuraea africana]
MRAWIRAFGRRRRLLAAALTALALACGLTVLRPGPGPTTAVLVAAKDLKPGPLRPGDLRAVRLPSSAVPDGALHTGAVGRILASPLRRGEPVTDVRLLGPGLLATLPPGTVATPVRIADPDAARLLVPGDSVGVLAAWDGGQAAQTVAERMPVITVPPSQSEAGALVVLAASPDQARMLAAAQAGGHLSVTINSRTQ